MSRISRHDVALLHFNGPDASTTFKDETGRPWTANGAEIDTAQSKFGGASGFFGGSGKWIDTPDSVDFTLGSGNFTIEMWLKKNLDGVTQYFAGQCDSGATTFPVQLAILSTNKLASYFQWGTSVQYFNIVSSASITTASGWTHVAFVRNGNTITQHINGAADGSADATGKTIVDGASKWAIGRIGEYTSNTYNGWIDEFRFNKGIARWTSNFTPYNKEYRQKKGVQG